MESLFFFHIQSIYQSHLWCSKHVSRQMVWLSISDNYLKNASTQRPYKMKPNKMCSIYMGFLCDESAISSAFDGFKFTPAWESFLVMLWEKTKR